MSASDNKINDILLQNQAANDEVQNQELSKAGEMTVAKTLKILYREEGMVHNILSLLGGGSFDPSLQVEVLGKVREELRNDTGEQELKNAA